MKLNRCVFNDSRGHDCVFFKKKMGANYRYKKCTRRGSVWYKKLVPGTKVLFDDFLGRAVRGFRKLERFSFWFPFPVPAKRNLSRRRAFFELKRVGGSEVCLPRDGCGRSKEGMVL